MLTVSNIPFTSFAKKLEALKSRFYRFVVPLSTYRLDGQSDDFNHSRYWVPDVSICLNSGRFCITTYLPCMKWLKVCRSILSLHFYKWRILLSKYIQGVPVHKDKFKIRITLGLSYIRKHSWWLACSPIFSIWVSSKYFQKSCIGWPQ